MDTSLLIRLALSKLMNGALVAAVDMHKQHRSANTYGADHIVYE